MVACQEADAAPNGGASENRRLAVIAAIESAHTFPGFFPVVVIARRGEEFEDRLSAALFAAQGTAPFAIRQRASSGGNYVAYHVEVHVESASVALDRRDALARLEGVLATL
jgi:putative lipoic acid-binding regulatory protein